MLSSIARAEMYTYSIIIWSPSKANFSGFTLTPSQKDFISCFIIEETFEIMHSFWKGVLASLMLFSERRQSIDS